MSEDTLTAIKVALGKIEVTTEATSRRMEVIETKLSGVMVDKDLDPMREQIKSISIRLKSLESFQTWLQRGILALVFAALFGLLVTTKKAGM